MRKKRVILLCLSAVMLALIALFAINPSSHEPSYNGRPLSYWVAQLTGHEGFLTSLDKSDYDKATNAIDQIDVAALPFLMKWIQYELPAWRANFGRFLNRTPFVTAHLLSDRITVPPAYQLAMSAPSAFGVLGKRALPAFNDLCRLINETNRPYTALEAAAALVYLGTNALPTLVAVATNANHPARLGALRAMGQMSDLGDAAPIAVTAITNCLSTGNKPTVQLIATIALGDLKAAPEISVPALVSCLKSKNAKLREYSAVALGQFGPEALSAIPALTNVLADTNFMVKMQALRAVRDIDPPTYTNALATFTNVPGR